MFIKKELPTNIEWIRNPRTPEEHDPPILETQATMAELPDRPAAVNTPHLPKAAMVNAAKAVLARQARHLSVPPVPAQVVREVFPVRAPEVSEARVQVDSADHARQESVLR